MKATKFITIVLILMITELFGSFQNQQDHKVLFEKAKYTMETKADLKEAITLFESLIKTYPNEKEYVAKSLLYQGMCYEKLGNQEAVKKYQHLVQNYPEQKNEVALAMERLTKLLALQDIPRKPSFRRINIPTKLSWRMSLSPDGEKLAFVSSDRKIWTIPLSGKLGSEFPGVPVKINTDDVEVDWTGLAWSGDGKWIAFNGSADKLIEKKGNQGIYIVPAEGGDSKKVHENFRHSLVVNYKISLSPDAKMLAFSSVDSNQCHINTISVNGGLPRQLVDAQAREPVFSPDGKMIAYVDTKDLGRMGGGLWVIPVSGGTPKLVANAGNASSPVWSPLGDMIAFLDGQQICIVPVIKDGAASEEVVKIDVPKGTGGIMYLAGWTPDNKIGVIFRSQTEFGLYTLPATGGTAAMVSHGGYPAQPRWSTDGKRIFHTNNVDEGSGDWERYSLAVVPADGGKITTIPIQFDEKIIKPVWGGGNNVSPDGKMIVFSGQTKKDTTWRWQIWTLPVDGGTPKQLTKPPVSVLNGFPCWSPDGKSIVYVSANADKANSTGFYEVNIYSVPVNGGDPKVLTSDSDSVKFSPIAWSPDGKFIAYYSNVEKDRKAGVLKILSVNDGVSHVVKKLQLAHTHIELAWSPDSKKIAFNYGTEAYGKNIRVVSINDGSITDIETGLEDINMYHLDWSRDGDRFVFSGFQGDKPEFWFMEDFLPNE